MLQPNINAKGSMLTNDFNKSNKLGSCEGSCTVFLSMGRCRGLLESVGVICYSKKSRAAVFLPCF